ncbi:PQQ-binding-like beta-propeller repeat protein [Croceibacterium sp. TMG7-5b_MA50]|uniref:outer membrane protein assembly factor BamB family protein n=1 Tax=Croceibacterium sp. TMG7-5b_MA50 TaxID=3121290 RepID=UPI003221DE6D
MLRNTRTLLALPLLSLLAACGIFGGDDGPRTPTVGNRTPILSRVSQVVEADEALAGTPVVLPAQAPTPDWPQPGGNAAKSPGHAALSAAPTRVWDVQIAGSTNRRRLAASPVVGGGSLFVVDTDGVVHAFDAASGAVRWTHRIEVPRNLAGVTYGGGASYFDGRLYVTDGAGDVIAMNATDGTEIWRQKPAGPLRGAPTVAFNAVYVMTQDNQIHALAMADGKPIWRDVAASGQSGVFGVAAPAAGQGTVIAGYSSGELVAYRYENGRTLWSDALARTSLSTQVGSLTDVDADPIIDAGRVYALGQGGRMAAYELLTGQRVWELNLAGISTPTIAGDWIFTLTDDSRLLAIAKATGRVKWITQLQRWRDAEDREGPVFWTGPVAAGGKLWIASSRGSVQSVDPATGAATPFTDLDEAVNHAPTVAGGMLYIMDESGRITAFR